MPMNFYESEEASCIRNVMMTECTIYKDEEMSEEIDEITIATDELTMSKVYFVDAGRPIKVPITNCQFTILEEVFDGITGSSLTISFADINEVIDPNENVLNDIKTIKEDDLKDFSIANDPEKCKSFLDSIKILNQADSVTSKSADSFDDCYYFIKNDDGTYEYGTGVIRNRSGFGDGLKSIWNGLKKLNSAIYNGVAKVINFVKDKVNIFIDYIVDGIKCTYNQ